MGHFGSCACCGCTCLAARGRWICQLGNASHDATRTGGRPMGQPGSVRPASTDAECGTYRDGCGAMEQRSDRRGTGSGKPLGHTGSFTKSGRRKLMGGSRNCSNFAATLERLRSVNQSRVGNARRSATIELGRTAAASAGSAISGAHCAITGGTSCERIFRRCDARSGGFDSVQRAESTFYSTRQSSAERRAKPLGDARRYSPGDSAVVSSICRRLATMGQPGPINGIAMGSNGNTGPTSMGRRSGSAGNGATFDAAGIDLPARWRNIGSTAAATCAARN